VRELRDRDAGVGDVKVAVLGRSGIGFVGWDGECGHDGVRVVVALHVFAEELGAFDIEEGAVEELELLGGVVGARGKTLWGSDGMDDG
jgi:hypothetical protein